MWLTCSEISEEYNIAVNTVKNFISSGRIKASDIEYRPLRVYMSTENCQLFSLLKDTKYIHENSRVERDIDWNISSYECYTSNYNCDKCIYSKLESLKKCNMPNVIEELLLRVGEPPQPNTKDFEKMMSVRNNYKI